jgi:hypothetical protein
VKRLVMTIILAMLIQAAPRETFAQIRSVDQYLIGGDSTFVIFVDAESIKIEGSTRQYWRTMHWREPTKIGVSYAKSLMNVDCARDTTAIFYGAYYDKLGSVITSGSPDKSESPVIPGTIGDKEFQFVCASTTERLNMDVYKMEDTLEAAANWFEVQ